jgi:hypothetical protein
MSTFASLDSATKARVQQAVDTLYRPLMGQVAKLLGSAVVASDAFLASPSGATSTPQSPAADSILGILAALDSGQVVPIGGSGLAGAQPLVKDQITGNTVNLLTVLAQFNTDAARQSYALAAGAGNILS